MSEIKLVASDGGRGADGAVRLADSLARADRGTPEVFAVAEPFDLHTLEGVPARPEGYTVLEEARAEDLRASVKWQLETQLGTPRDWPIAVGAGDRASTIARRARTRATGVVLAGRAPRLALEGRPSDETALRLASLSPTPVLAVAAGASALPRRVLVAIDLGEPSLWAALASRQIVAHRATVFVVHVAPERTELEPFPSLRPWREAYERAVSERLGEIAARLRGAGDVETECIVASGEPARELLVLADRLGVELITAGGQRLANSGLAMSGRTASALLRERTHSVLVHPGSLRRG